MVVFLGRHTAPPQLVFREFVACQTDTLDTLGTCFVSRCCILALSGLAASVTRSIGFSPLILGYKEDGRVWLVRVLSSLVKVRALNCSLLWQLFRVSLKPFQVNLGISVFVVVCCILSVVYQSKNGS